MAFGKETMDLGLVAQTLIPKVIRLDSIVSYYGVSYCPMVK